MSGLELKEHGVDMRGCPKLMGWWWSEVWIRNVIRMRNWSQGWVWNCKYDLMFFYCRFMNVGLCQRVNSLGSLGETSGVALQWSGRNPMAPGSGCPWW